MIWIIGGTKDSRILIEKLASYTKNIIVSITTLYGKKLILDYDIKILDIKLTKEEKKDFIKKYNIKAIIDTSHPYAQNVSKTMMELAKITKIAYLRYERPSLKYKGSEKFENMDLLVKYLNKTYKDGNILSTLGTKNLDDLKKIKPLENLFIRILPVSNSLKKAEDLGFFAKNIIAIQGPFSQTFNKAIIKNYNIKYLLTKESGKEGGELEKIIAANECNTKVLVLKRPKLNYPIKVENFEDIISFLKSKGVLKNFI